MFESKTFEINLLLKLKNDNDNNLLLSLNNNDIILSNQFSSFQLIISSSIIIIIDIQTKFYYNYGENLINKSFANNYIFI